MLITFCSEFVLGGGLLFVSAQCASESTHAGIRMRGKPLHGPLGWISYDTMHVNSSTGVYALPPTRPLRNADTSRVFSAFCAANCNALPFSHHGVCKAEAFLI